MTMMVKSFPKRPPPPVRYAEPDRRELLRLCRDFGLVQEYEVGVNSIRMRCLHEVFEVSPQEADLLMKGLLLGFFYNHSRDDLSLADWGD
jgi:hypothetical protein